MGLCNYFIHRLLSVMNYNMIDEILNPVIDVFHETYYEDGEFVEEIVENEEVLEDWFEP